MLLSVPNVFVERKAGLVFNSLVFVFIKAKMKAISGPARGPWLSAPSRRGTDWIGFLLDLAVFILGGRALHLGLISDL